MAEITCNVHKQVETHEERLQVIEERLDQLTNMVHTIVANQNTLANRYIQIGGEGDHHMFNMGVSLVGIFPILRGIILLDGYLR